VHQDYSAYSLPDPFGASLHGSQLSLRSGDSNAFTFYEAWNTTQAMEIGYSDRWIYFVVQCARRDPACVWTQADIQKFSRTFTEYVWKEPAGANCHSYLVDGNGCGGATNSTGSTGAYQLGWSRLGRYNTQGGLDIQRRFELYDQPGSSKLNKGYAASRAASGALNARLLANP
jgi:hypothetical protein